MKKTILVIEPFSENEEHLAVNTKILSYWDKNNDLYFCGSSKYCSKLKDNKVNFNHCFCISYKPRTLREFIRRYLHIFNIIIKNSYKLDEIVFLSFDNSLFFIFLLLSKVFLFRYKKKILVFSHYNTYTLYSNRIKKILFKFTTYIYHSIQYIALTEVAYDTLSNIVNKKNVLFVKHPINEKISIVENFNKEDNVLRYTIVGRQAKIAINTGFIYELIDILDLIARKSKLQIELIIGSNLSLNLEGTRTLKIDKRNNLSSQEYSALFRSSDFIVFPEKKEDSFRASGILIDALSHKIPFIAPFHGHFKEFINCGIFYNNKDINEKIQYSAHLSKQEYLILVNNIIRKTDSIESENNIIFSNI